MQILCAQSHHPLVIDKYLSNRAICRSMGFKRGILIQIGPVKRGNAALYHQPLAYIHAAYPISVAHKVVARPQQFLYSVEGQCRDGCRHGMDAGRREGNAGNLDSQLGSVVRIRSNQRGRLRALRLWQSRRAAVCASSCRYPKAKLPRW